MFNWLEVSEEGWVGGRGGSVNSRGTCLSDPTSSISKDRRTVSGSGFPAKIPLILFGCLLGFSVRLRLPESAVRESWISQRSVREFFRHSYILCRLISTSVLETSQPVPFENPRMFGYKSVKKNTSSKVMVAFGEQTFRLLSEEARARGVTIQELLRAVIIPDWFKARYEPAPSRSPVIERTTREEEPVVPYSFSNKLRY